MNLQADARLRAIGVAAGIVRDAVAGAVLTWSGTVLPLPGLPDHRLLAPDSPALAEVGERLDAGDAYAVFLHPSPDTAALLRISVLHLGGEDVDHLRAVVLVSPAPDLRGLSERELRVLGFVVEDWPDARVAEALGMTPQDVAACIRRSMDLLGAPSRTGLAVRALREGLFLPRRLLGSG